MARILGGDVSFVVLLCLVGLWGCGGSDAVDPYIAMDGVLQGWPDAWGQDAAFPDGVTIACEQDEDCGPYYCDGNTGTCQECLITSQCPTGHECEKNHCELKEDGCTKDADCGADLFCDTGLGKCVFCLTVEDCDPGHYCLDG